MVMESALANVQHTNRGVISPMYTATQMKNADWRLLASCIAIAVLGSTAAESQTKAVIYEGARLIVGDASAPIENGAFVVRDGRITAIGPKGSVQAPSGATHVDLTSKTVMPAMNNIHAHLGYEGYVSWSVENHTAENVLDHLEREAFYGVGATLSMGEQPTDFAIEFQQNQLAGKFPPAARFFFAAGMAPPGGGPDALLIQGTGPLHAVYEVSTPDEAVAAVRKIAAKKVSELKFWVDNRDNSRGSTRKKMPPEVYTAVIAEAHKHGMIVHAHATNLEDQKGVVKAGVDVLVHTLMAEKVDDEFIAILKSKKPFWTPVMGLGDRSELCDGDNGFIEQVLPDSVIADIKAGKAWLPSPPCSAPASAQFLQREENLRYNFPKYLMAGARIVLGTDAGVSAKYSYGFAEHHEIGMYVRLGLTPAEAIIASTSRPTEVLRIKDTGVLAKGKRADLMVLNANPLENIRNTREIDSVYLDGARLDRVALQIKFKQAVVDRDATKAKVQKDYVPHPPSSRKLLE
jgi:imidazolonepropionase-like amidohydrolase